MTTTIALTTTTEPTTSSASTTTTTTTTTTNTTTSNTYINTGTNTESKETKFKHTNNGWFYFTNNQPGFLYQSSQNFPSKLGEIEEIQNLIPTVPFPWFYPNSPTADNIQNYNSPR